MQTHIYIFTGGYREIGTGETVAVLLNQECGGEKKPENLKTLDIILINTIYQKPLKTTDFVHLISL